MMRSRFEIECKDCDIVVARTDDPRDAHDIAISESKGAHSDHTVSVFARGVLNRLWFDMANRGRCE